MVDLPEVQDRSRRVFEDLLRQSGRVPPTAAIREPALAPGPPPGARVAPPPARFSVFDVTVTARVFIAPEEPPGDAAEERRWWIELDKFIQPVPAHRRLVVFRPDELSSIIKKPADKDPAALPQPQPGGDDGGSYCQCGWPYTLMLPRGTSAGLGFRLLVLLTDAALDQVPQHGDCGSMTIRRG